MQAKQAIAPSFCLKTISTGMAEAFLEGCCGFIFIKYYRTTSGMAGICRGRCSMAGSVLWVGLEQQTKPFFLPKEPILVYSHTQWERREVFLGSSNGMFSRTSGCESQDVINTQADRQQPTAARCERVASLRRLLVLV